MRILFDNNTYKLDFSELITPMQQVQKQIADIVVNDIEGKIRAALIELGWTPPKGKDQ